MISRVGLMPPLLPGLRVRVRQPAGRFGGAWLKPFSARFQILGDDTSGTGAESVPRIPKIAEIVLYAGPLYASRVGTDHADVNDTHA
jgi:hypothetical protein